VPCRQVNWPAGTSGRDNHLWKEKDGHLHLEGKGKKKRGTLLADDFPLTTPVEGKGVTFYSFPL